MAFAFTAIATTIATIPALAGQARIVFGFSGVLLLGVAIADRFGPKATGVRSSRGGGLLQWSKTSAPAAALALWAWCAAVDIVREPGASPRIPATTVAGSVALTLLLRTGAISLSGRAAALIAMLTLDVSLILALAFPAWRPCDPGKCTALGSLYTGPFVSENYLGFVATMTLTLTLVYLRGRERVFSIGVCVAIVAATGARTGLIISLVVVTLYTLLHRRGSSNTRIPAKVFAPAVAIGISATATYLIYSATPTTLSNRGNIWSMARPIIDQAPLTGVGLSAWTRLQNVGLLPQHFSHSEYLMVIFSGGYIGLALFTWLVAALIHIGTRSSSSDRVHLQKALPVIAFALYGTTEVVWNPLAIDGFTWIFLLVALVALSEASLENQSNVANNDDQLGALSTLV